MIATLINSTTDTTLAAFGEQVIFLLLSAVTGTVQDFSEYGINQD